jgi:putative SOS response-associated peptidase YedK
MCGRFTSTTPPRKLQELFRLAGIATEAPPRYNIAPSQPVPVVVNDGRRLLELLHWGLVPWWAKEPKLGQRMANVRSESLVTKAAFREALEHRRCIVLADGFYEWKAVGGRKVPHFIRRKDGKPFALAGLWDRWGSGAAALRSCTILTIPPAGLFAALHDRMPAILRAEDVEAWLSPGGADAAPLRQLLIAPPTDEWTAYAVSTRVNKPDHDAPDCIEPATDEPPRQMGLFEKSPSG